MSRVSNILTGIMITATTVSSGCLKRAERPFKQIEGTNIYKIAVDSFAKKSKKALKDTSLICFFRDTLEFSPDVLKKENKENLLNYIKELAMDDMPKVKIGVKEGGLDLGVKPSGGVGIVMTDDEDILINKYTSESITPVIEGLFQAKELKEAPTFKNLDNLDTLGTKYYIAVSAYGKLNSIPKP